MQHEDPQTYAILGACFSVHSAKGCGLNEPVYQECLEIELEYCGIPFERECEFRIQHRGRWLTQRYYADFVCYGQVLLECKAVEKLIDKHRSQVLNYMNIAGLRRGLLVNFGGVRLEYERFIL